MDKDTGDWYISKEEAFRRLEEYRERYGNAHAQIPVTQRTREIRDRQARAQKRWLPRGTEHSW